MKTTVPFSWVSAALVTLLTMHCGRRQEQAVKPAELVNQVMSIAQLRALTSPAMPTRVYITDHKKNGIFLLDPNDNRSSDNLGLILVTAGGQRYKRAFTGSASAAWFGMDESDDDIGPELQAAVDAADDVMVPDGHYTQLTRVNLRSHLKLRANPGRALISLPKEYVSLGNGDPAVPLVNVLIDGLAWQAVSDQEDKLGEGRIHIDGPSVDNLTVQNCSSTDRTARATTNWFFLKVQSGKTANNITVRNNSAQAKRMGCEIINHDNFSLYSGRNIVITDNYFRSCQFGISLSGTLENLLVDNNHLKDCSLYGIEIAGAARKARITNNRFEGIFGKIFAGSNDGGGNGTVIGGMDVSYNLTLGLCQGGIQLFNGGTISFSNNVLTMTGFLEVGHATAGGRFTDNIIESQSDKAVVCDNSPNNVFIRNIISNKNNPQHHTTILVYGSKAKNNHFANNTLIKGEGGFYIDALLGGTYTASMNFDENGNLIR
ncbi:right-handed parallel beta-helix repeat-containing protein [Larkinella soli]|uniref:right-handed parallel beta-helix repeat-containing protein n=1 Tax=Larkinella soli TaxID=1770527 RepID=UPI000FFBD381|nr:right-handed parallel beta-helix repeat-containing protein [Larkinella soli]